LSWVQVGDGLVTHMRMLGDYAIGFAFGH
jgi:hypothetical protein